MNKLQHLTLLFIVTACLVFSIFLHLYIYNIHIHDVSLFHTIFILGSLYISFVFTKCIFKDIFDRAIISIFVTTMSIYIVMLLTQINHTLILDNDYLFLTYVFVTSLILLFFIYIDNKDFTLKLNSFKCHSQS